MPDHDHVVTSEQSKTGIGNMPVEIANLTEQHARTKGTACAAGGRTLAVAIAAMALAAPAAAQTTVDIFDTATGTQRLGSVMLEEEVGGGVRFTPDLSDILPAGDHGFHAHVNPACGDGGQAAGGHYDPGNTGRHEGPDGDGHLGDLPRLTSEAGHVATAVVAPRLTMSDLYGRALVIHEGGDNYSDSPEPLGGGGARLACGVVPAAVPELLAISAHARRRGMPAPDRD